MRVSSTGAYFVHHGTGDVVGIVGGGSGLEKEPAHPLAVALPADVHVGGVVGKANPGGPAFW